MLKNFNNLSPVVSFDLSVATANGVLAMPSISPTGDPEKDNNGVTGRIVHGSLTRHIGDIAGQASGIGNSDLDLAEGLRRVPTLTSDQKAALDWLQANAIDLHGEAVVWHYTADLAFNDLMVKAGWPSAFAQADVIKAFILAYKRSRDDKFLRLARKAARAFDVSCEAGGLKCTVGGITWYEEVPVPFGYAPMILNGHLYALIMLKHLYDLTGDPRIKASFEEGVASAGKMLTRYDTGYWTVYQLRPRVRDVPVALVASGSKVLVKELRLTSPMIEPSVLDLANRKKSTYAGNLAHGEGWSRLWRRGHRLKGVGQATLLPGPIKIDNDPVTYGHFEVTAVYEADSCSALRIATIDYRAESRGWMLLPTDHAVVQDGRCTARAVLRNAVIQWSQLDSFYHRWHTRLVTELWRCTGDPTFYAAAIRWNQYRRSYEKLGEDRNPLTLREPIFDSTDSPEDDEAITAALQGAEPAELTDGTLRSAINAAASLGRWQEERREAILRRVGIAP